MKLLPIEIEGARELDMGLAALGKEVATTLGHKAFKASAAVLKAEWERSAPFQPGSTKKYWTLASGETRIADYGHLRSNIRMRKVTPRKENAIVYAVNTGNAFWAYFLEFGTVKMPPHPWARPANERAKSKVLSTQIETLRAGMEAIASKSRRGRSRIKAGQRIG